MPPLLCKDKKEKTTLMLPPMKIMVLHHRQVGLSLYTIPTWAFSEVGAPSRLHSPFRGECLECAWTSRPTSIFSNGKLLVPHG